MKIKFKHNKNCDCDICYYQKDIAKQIFKKYGHTMLKYAQEGFKKDFKKNHHYWNKIGGIKMSKINPDNISFGGRQDG